MTKKEKLYYLIEHYMLGDYDTQTYANELSDIVCHSDVEEQENQLTSEECTLFRDIEKIASRVSCFKSDFEKYPGVYFTEIDIRKKTIEVCKKLNIKY